MEEENALMTACCDGDIARVTALVHQQQGDTQVFRHIAETIELAVEEVDIKIVELLLDLIFSQGVEESQQEQLRNVAYWQQLLGVALKNCDATTLNWVDMGLSIRYS